MTLRRKITLTYVAITVLGVALVSLITSNQVSRFLDRRAAATVHSHVDVLATLLENRSLSIDPGGSQDATLAELARSMDLRITVIDSTGRVLYDSSVPRNQLGRLDNHLNRPEIQQAHLRSIGRADRHSATLDADLLYYARALHMGSGELHGGYVRAAVNVQELSAFSANIQRVIWAVGLLTIMLLLVVSSVLARRITRPIQQIAATADAIKGGDVMQRVHLSSNDEIGTLATGINDMAEKLGNDIEKLRKLERVRSEFLANVSHELRTPIFSIQGFLETLLDGAVDDPHVNREFLEKAHHHANRLNALLSDLIEISRIESGEMKMSFRYFSVSDFLQQVLKEMEPQAAKKSISLKIGPLPSGDEMVYGDRERLKQVMINLIDNAVKYTEPGGSITVQTSPEGAKTAIHVRDTGSGIAQEHQARIFERFYRVDRDRSREVGGTGLGLAIVKHIVEAHGGTIRVESEAGKGSIFTFTLKR
jgi:two-component system, OmpR family, phosphate regulon sensor histidine kinase PhoR